MNQHGHLAAPTPGLQLPAWPGNYMATVGWGVWASASSAMGRGGPAAAFNDSTFCGGAISGQRGGQRGTLQSSRRARAGSCTWGGTTPGTSTGWGLPCGEGLGVLGYDNLTTSQQRAPRCHEGQRSAGVLWKY